MLLICGHNITPLKNTGNKTHSSNTKVDITIPANNYKFKHILLPNMPPPPPTSLDTHTHTHTDARTHIQSVTSLFPISTHKPTRHQTSYPPLPCTQALKRPQACAAMQSVAQRWDEALLAVAVTGSWPATPQLPALLYGKQRG